MQHLLEDYQRRLKTVSTELAELINKGREEDVETCRRLTTKASCYRTFIVELEREILKEN